MTNTARPVISYSLAGTDTQYDIIASGTPDSGDCVESGSGASDNKQYTCRYTVASGNNGTFTVKVGTSTADLAGNTLASTYTHGTTLTADTTAPTVSSSNTGYYTTSSLGTELSGSVKSGTDIYTKVTFSEAVAATAANDSTARPVISYSLAGTDTQYDIIASGTPDSGDCVESGSGASDNKQYTCRYTVASGNNGTFTVKVGTSTADLAGNTLANTYTHGTTLTTDTTSPTMSSVTAVNSTVTVTMSEVVYAGTTPTASDFKVKSGASGSEVANVVTGITGLPTTVGSADNSFTLTVTNAFTHDDSVKVYYTKGSNAVKDRADNELATLAEASALTTTGIFREVMVSTVATDDYINASEDDSTLTISGTSTGLTTGTTVTVAVDGSGTDISGKTGTTNVSGAWSVSLTAAEVQALDASTPDAAGEDLTITATAPNAASGTRTITYDPTAPTFSTVVASGTTLTVTMDESVYAATVPDNGDFVITGGGAPTISNIAGLPTTVATADNSFTLTIASALTAPPTIAYTRNSTDAKIIKDKAGNKLATVSGKSVSGVVRAPTGLDLASGDDTGASNTDNITKTTSNLTITGCAKADSTVTLLKNGSAFSPAKTDTADGSTCTNGTDTAGKGWSIDIDLTASGTPYAITATATSGSSTSVTSAALDITVDTIAPTVTSSSTGYYTSSALSTELTGSVNSGTDIYTKVTFSEVVAETIANDNTARPVISYSLAGTDTQYDIIASGSPASGDCVESGSGASDNKQYTCRYTVASGNTGSFGVKVGTSTADLAGNTLASTYIHNASLTADTTLPTISSASYNGSSITLTMSESVSVSGTKTGGDFTVTGGGAPTVSSYTISNRTITLTLASALTTGATVTLAYAKNATAANRITDGAGNELAAVSSQNVLSRSVSISAVATDDYINATEDNSAVLIAGTSSGLANNTTVTITLDDADADTNADHTFTATTNSSGAWTTDSSDLTAARVQALDEGAMTITASATGAGSGVRTVTYDATAPTVSSSNTGYYTTSSLGTELSGSVKSGTEIYTKVSFSEVIAETTANDNTARPVISYSLAGTDTQYDIIASGTPDSGDCVESGSGSTDNKQYTCRYTVASGNTGSFGVKVGTSTADPAGNTLASTYTHSATLTADTTLPTMSSVVAEESTVRITMSEVVYAGTTPTATDFKVKSGTSGSETANTVTGITGLATTKATADTSFDLTVTTTFTHGDSVKVYYTKGSNAVKDRADNELATVAEASALTATATVKTVSIATVATDDYLNASEDDSTLTISGTSTGLTTGTTVTVAVDGAGTDISGRTGTTNSSGNWSVSLTAAEVKALDASTPNAGGESITITATAPDAASGTRTITYDHILPTVSSSNTGYYSDSALGTELSGSVKSGTDIYTKVSFSEVIGETVANDNTARPVISYSLAGTDTQYDIIASGSPASGDCVESGSGASDNKQYTCRYTVASGNTGSFGVKVGTSTADPAGNTLASTYTHSATLTADTTLPTISSIIVVGTTATVTMSESVYAATVPDNGDFVITGGGAPTISSISGLPSTVATADNSFTMTLSSALTGAATLAYTQNGTDGKRIKDTAGNATATASSVTITEKSVSISTVATDDYINATEDNSAVLIAGTSVGLATNTTITITLDDADGDTNADHSFTATTNNTGAWTTSSSDLTAARVQALDEGVMTITASATGAGSGTRTVTYDATAPTVSSSNTGYYTSSALSTELTGSVSSGTEIYTKVSFSEVIGETVANDNTARPVISYSLAGTDTQYDIIASGTPASGDCVESGSGNADNKQYTCRYTVASGNTGSFGVKVGTSTADPAGNTLASAYTHSATLTADTTLPTIASAYYDGTSVVLTMSEPVYAATAPTATDFKVSDDGTAITVSGSDCRLNEGRCICDDYSDGAGDYDRFNCEGVVHEGCNETGAGCCRERFGIACFRQCDYRF